MVQENEYFTAYFYHA